MAFHVTDLPTEASSTQNKLLLLRARPVGEWQLATVLSLMRDTDAGVRDWATFALAIRDDDGEEVRQALLERAEDSDFGTRSEALLGLARRRDARAVPLLIEALQGEAVGQLFVEAAAYLAHPGLVPYLKAPLEWDVEPELLQEAILRCSGKAVPEGRCWDLVPANDRTP